MANRAEKTAIASANFIKETPLDKTTRIVRRIKEDEAEVRHQKTARLRKARFESEADTPDEVIMSLTGKS